MSLTLSSVLHLFCVWSSSATLWVVWFQSSTSYRMVWFNKSKQRRVWFIIRHPVLILRVRQRIPRRLTLIDTMPRVLQPSHQLKSSGSRRTVSSMFLAMLALRSSTSDALKGYAHLELDAVALQPHLATAANATDCAVHRKTPSRMLKSFGSRRIGCTLFGNARAHEQRK